MRLDQAAPTQSFDTTVTPYRGVESTLNAMRKLAKEGQTSPAVRRHAVEVIRRVQPKDHLSELAALYYDTCRRIRYTRDPAEAEYLMHPELTLRHRAGDCDDMATLLAAMLGAASLSVGNPTQFVTVGFSEKAGRNPYTHVFLRAKDEQSGRWAVMDPVAGPDAPTMIRKSRRFKGHWTD